MHIDPPVYDPKIVDPYTSYRINWGMGIGPGDTHESLIDPCGAAPRVVWQLARIESNLDPAQPNPSTP